MMLKMLLNYLWPFLQTSLNPVLIIQCLWENGYFYCSNICINFTKSECDLRILSEYDINLTPNIINVRLIWVIETSTLLTENINRQPMSFQNGILLLPNLIVVPALRPWKKYAFIGTDWNRLKHKVWNKKKTATKILNQGISMDQLVSYLKILFFLIQFPVFFCDKNCRIWWKRIKC